MIKGSSHEFEGVHLGQTPEVENYFKNLVTYFDRIIEIGTYAGGLSLLMYRYKLENTELISYDINSEFNTVNKSIPIDFRIGDVFEENVRNEIISLITEKDKRILLICDGGNKNEEFNLFSKYLKLGDVIMIHDFKESDDDFDIVKNNCGWVYPPESSLEKIQQSINENYLIPFNYDKAKSIIWGSFMKNKKV